MFPYRAGGDGAQDEPYAGSLDAVEPQTLTGDGLEKSSTRRWSNRSVALVILSIMVTMAAIGFTFAWYTTESRRQRDRMGALSAASSPDAIVPVAPGRLAALGYLPAGTNAIAGIHIAELMTQVSTEPLLQLLRSNREGFGIDRLEQSTGLRLEDLDHVVLGLKMQEGGVDLPQIVLIAQTRRPYDRKRVLARLNAKGPIELPDKKVYKFTPEQAQLGGVLWCASDQTLVFGLQSKDLVGLPATPIPDLSRFPAQVRKGLVDPDMAEGTQAWVVGASTHWEDLLVPLQLLGLANADRQLFSQVRAFNGRLHCSGSVLCQVDCKCVDIAGAEKLDKYLAAKGLDARHLHKLAANEPRAAGLLQELAQSLVRTPNGADVLVRFAVRTETIRRALAHAAELGRTVD
jgi:hypothetical protein